MDKHSKKAMSHLTGENLPYIEQLYAQYLDDPSAVDPSWEPVFEEYFGDETRDAIGGPRFEPRSIFSPIVLPGESAGLGDDVSFYEDTINGTQIHTPGKSSGFAAKVETLVRAYRLYGHKGASINPLFHEPPDLPPELDPANHGISEADMSAPVRCEALFNGREVELGQVVERLREIYCGPITIEYQHISETESRRWIRSEVERHTYAELGDDAPDQTTILKDLLDADSFESFLQKKYGASKRFSLTGGDSLIPMLRALLNEGGNLGVGEVLIGMAHRGRLNVLHNIMGKPAANMFSEFERSQTPEKYIGSSDVKYHMGYSSDFKTYRGDEVHLSLAFNPSHLEFVDPVVVGRTRAKQARISPEDQGQSARHKVMPLLLHGDAAFSGQGIVAETFNLSMLPGYDVGGTVHIVINNQIGFTTTPEEGRSMRYSTGIAKMIEVPILHVNGDRPEACVRAALLAMRYRQKFGRDVVIDLVCYRQYGHNEGDEPRFTQPLMYKLVDSNSPVRAQYAQHLLDQGVVSEDELETMWNERMDTYDPIYNEIQAEPKPKTVNSLGGVWNEYHGGAVSFGKQPDTRVSREELERLGQTLSSIPDTFSPHRTIRRLFQKRERMAQGEEPLDWGMGEMLAFASLLGEGRSIRLTGQDSIRGTFSHRHAAIMDTETGASFWPAREIGPDQGHLTIVNSSLSEAAVLGFEYGYSLDTPSSLVMWEAQFGDFVNGAQVIIDQFINSGEDKWQRLSGLTMLLPHGYEGQGPEHSSARLERFLQLCAEDNMFVCNMTTPAQYFHALRRQVLSEIRKPLIVMTPKSLLRLPEAVSSLEDLSDRGFQHVIPEVREAIVPDQVERVLLCSGKIYYDLIAYAAEHDHPDVAVVRVEQLYPLDTEAIKQAVAPYANISKLVWVQEEPRNMGPWTHMFPHLLDLFADQNLRPIYVGRVASASPATGDPEAHKLEQNHLLRAAFGD